MSSVVELYKQSELALAAYANLVPGIPGVPELTDAGMAPAQAERFAQGWVVVEQYRDASGVSATVFADSSGKKYLAVRGTDAADDFLANTFILAGWPRILNPQFAALRTQVQAWMSTGVLPQTYTITGHSLGGYLATGLAAAFNLRTEPIYLLNTPGVAGISGSVFDSLKATLGLGDVALASNVQNIRASSGLSLIAGLGLQLAPPTFIETEFSANPITNHKIATITDALAVYALVSELAPALGLVDLGMIVKASSSSSNNTLERAVNAVAKLIAVSEVSTGDIDDRDKFYEALYATQAKVPTVKPGLLVSLVGKDVPTIEAQAFADIGYRYALKELIPFAITGNASLYTMHNSSAGRLDVYNPTTGQGTLTSQWITDRAGLLEAVIASNLKDTPNNALVLGPEGTAKEYHYFADGIERILFADPTDSPPGRHRTQIVAFADDVGRTLSGTDYVLADHLYGGQGNDSLSGFGGDDYLEGNGASDTLNGGSGNDELVGGAGDDHLSGGNGIDTLIGGKADDVLDGGLGDDVYVWNTGDGFDTIFDAREAAGVKSGTIQFMGQTLAGTKSQVQADNPGLFKDARLHYAFTGISGAEGMLSVVIPGQPGAGGLRIQGFKSGDFGIIIPLPAPLPTIDLFGTNEPNILAANAANQRVFGLGGGDRITVSTANSAGYGGLGNDVIRNGAGDQKLYGEDGNDALIATAGYDQLYGGLGNDWLQGGADGDYLEGNDGNDVLDGGAGADVIYGGAGADYILGGGSAVPGISDSQFVDPNGPVVGVIVVDGRTGIQGAAGATNIDGDEADYIDAGAGNDLILAGDGNDYVHAGADDDAIVGQPGDDSLLGGAGNDSLYGDGTEGSLFRVEDGLPFAYTYPEYHGADFLDGGDGDDSLTGDGGNDTLIGGAGNDVLIGDDSRLEERYHGADYLDGGDGNDRLLGYGKDDVLLGGGGDDDLEGDSSTVAAALHGNDYLDGEDGNDVVAGDGGSDTLFGGAGNDQLFGDTDDTPLAYQGNDYLDGEDGDDYLRGYGGNDELFGGAGADQLLAEAGDDYLDGGDGDDTLDGGSGEDILDGGPGNDLLMGGAGNDVYLLGAGGGNDTVADSGGTDSIQVSADAPASDVKLYRVGDDFVASIGGGNHQLWTQRFFIDQEYGQPVDYKIEQIQFGDGSLWDAATIAGNVIVGTQNNMLGTAGDDTFFVDHVQDSITEGANQGIDTVQSWVSYWLGANVENLTLTGELNVWGSGNELENVIRGNVGENHLYGGEGSDRMYGESGNDTLHGDLDLFVDSLYGGQGNDTYYIRGDEVIEAPNEGIDSIYITGEIFNYTLPANVENLLSGGGANWVGVRYITGNALDNIIYGAGARSFFSQPNVIDGAGGADTMYGTSSDDVYIVDNAGDKLIDGGAFSGMDTVKSSVSYALGQNIEQLILTGSAAITGTGNALGNRLDGSQNTAANVLAGGPGDDYYILGAGDSVVELANEGADTLQIDSNTVTTYDIRNYHTQIEGLALSNTTGASSLLGDDRGNPLTGNDSANTVRGGAGNDTLSGSGGDDVLDGGAGADELAGGYGKDIYSFDRGFGQDRILSQLIDVTPDYFNRDDTIAFGSTITAREVQIVGVNSDPHSSIEAIRFQIAGSTDSIDVGDYTTYNGQSYFPYQGRVSFADGTVWDLPAIFARYAANSSNAPSESNDTFAGTPGDDVIAALGGNDNLSGGAGNDLLDGGAGADTVFGNAGNDQLDGGTGNDTLWGNDGSDTLRGQDGNDHLFGNSGNDTLDGGAGDDVLEGGAGSDGYVFGRGSGVDLIEDITSVGGETDVVLMATGVLPADVNVANYGQDLELSINGTADRLWIVNFNLASAAENYQIEQVRFTDGTIWDVQTLKTLALTVKGTEGTDLLYGSDGDDKMYGYGGDDTLYGHGGNDLLEGGPGNDYLSGSDGNDTLNGGPGNDNLIGGSGDDIYYVDSAGDYVSEPVNSATGGVDTVFSSVSFNLLSTAQQLSLGGGITTITYSALENLTLTGTAAINGTGNALNNVLIGNTANNVLSGAGGNDTLDGRGGADSLIGGVGNDTYVVDNAGDVVTENAGAGTDSVQASITYTLSANVENLTLTGSATVNATGNTLNNLLIGNAAKNVLNGGAGVDTMRGGAGDDTYIVDNALDIVTENAAQGYDTIQASVTFTLPANVEKLLLTGTAAINGTGSTLNDHLVGNGVNNVLTGAAGNDLLNGGLGSDTLRGDAGFDILEGMDGNDALSDSGGNNLLNGGVGADTLTGNGGRDFFIGGSGNDTITTGLGADIIAFKRGDGQDTVNASTGADNTLALGGGIRYADMRFTRSANNLILGLGGSSEQITFAGWYDATANNKSVLNMQVIVEAMSDFNAASTDKLVNKKIANFNFLGLVSAFDAAGAPASWALTNALLSKHLSGSDTAALGGDLAYRYGRNGTLAATGFDPAVGILSSASFGTAAQTLQSAAALDVGVKRLS